jgi:hypothetical protein
LSSALVLALGLLVTGILPAPASAAPAKPPAPSKPACPAQRADEASAAIAAKLCGKRVEVTNQLSETTQVWANPDGTMTAERYLAPVRVKQGGKWVPVDLTLVRQADGSVAPKAHPRGLRLSGGVGGAGDHEVVSLGTGDQQVALSWTGALPAPVLSGATATYPNVRPDVDLLVTANATGYEQSFVVRSRAGLAQVAKLAMPVRTGKLTATPDAAGGLAFKDKAGTPVVQTHPAEMWDAAVAPNSLEHLHRAPVGLATTTARAGTTSLELTPDAAFLARDDLQFPVTIDPPTSLGAMFDAFVQTGWTSDQSGAPELKLGYSDDGGTFIARSYLKFDTSGMWDAGVLDATLNLWEWHSWSCTAYGWEAWRTSDAASWIRWTAQPTLYERIGTSTQTRGYSSSCNDGWVSIGVTPGFQTASTAHLSSLSVGLKGSSESNHLSWKRFDSAEGGHPPYVTITYNAPPAVPSNLTVAPCYTSCGAGAATSSLHPSLSAVVTDPNAGDSIRAEFEVWNPAHTALVASSGLLAGVGSGATVPWQVGANLVDGTAYEWRVHAFDGRNYSPWSAWIPITVDTTAPGVPFVSASLYANDGQPHGGAGVADTFTFNPASTTTDLGAARHRPGADHGRRDRNHHRDDHPAQ